MGGSDGGRVEDGTGAENGKEFELSSMVDENEDPEYESEMGREEMEEESKLEEEDEEEEERGLLLAKDGKVVEPFARWNLWSLLRPSQRAPRFQSTHPLRRDVRGATVRTRSASLPLRLLAAWPGVALAFVAAALLVGMPIVVALLYSYSAAFQHELPLDVVGSGLWQRRDNWRAAVDAITAVPDASYPVASLPRYALTVVYGATGGSYRAAARSSLLDEAGLMEIVRLENSLLSAADYHSYCLRASPASEECAMPASPLQYYFAWNSTQRQWGWPLWAETTEIPALTSTFLAAVNNGSGPARAMAGEEFNGGQSASHFLRSSFFFGLPLPGYASPFDRADAQREALSDWAADTLGPVLDDFSSGAVEVLYDGPGVSQRAVSSVFRRAHLAFLLVCFVFFAAALVYSNSAVVAVVVVAVTLCAYPLAAFAYNIVFRMAPFTPLHIAALVHVLTFGTTIGLAALDSFSESAAARSWSRTSSLRLERALRRSGIVVAGGALSMSFSLLLCAYTPLRSVREALIFAGVSPLLVLVLAAAVAPPALAFYRRYLEGRYFGLRRLRWYRKVLRRGLPFLRDRETEESHGGRRGRGPVSDRVLVQRALYESAMAAAAATKEPEVRDAKRRSVYAFADRARPLPPEGVRPFHLQHAASTMFGKGYGRWVFTYRFDLLVAICVVAALLAWLASTVTPGSSTFPSVLASTQQQTRYTTLTTGLPGEQSAFRLDTVPTTTVRIIWGLDTAPEYPSNRYNWAGNPDTRYDESFWVGNLTAPAQQYLLEICQTFIPGSTVRPTILGVGCFASVLRSWISSNGSATYRGGWPVPPALLESLIVEFVRPENWAYSLPFLDDIGLDGDRVRFFAISVNTTLRPDASSSAVSSWLSKYDSLADSLSLGARNALPLPFTALANVVQTTDTLLWPLTDTLDATYRDSFLAWMIGILMLFFVGALFANNVVVLLLACGSLLFVVAALLAMNALVVGPVNAVFQYHCALLVPYASPAVLLLAQAYSHSKSTPREYKMRDMLATVGPLVTVHFFAPVIAVLLLFASAATVYRLTAVYVTVICLSSLFALLFVLPVLLAVLGPQGRGALCSGDLRRIKHAVWEWRYKVFFCCRPNHETF